MKNRIKNFLLNRLLSEREKLVIIESIDDKELKTYGCMGESIRDLAYDIDCLRAKLKTKTKNHFYYDCVDKNTNKQQNKIEQKQHKIQKIINKIIKEQIK